MCSASRKIRPIVLLGSLLLGAGQLLVARWWARWRPAAKKQLAPLRRRVQGRISQGERSKKELLTEGAGGRGGRGKGLVKIDE